MPFSAFNNNQFHSSNNNASDYYHNNNLPPANQSQSQLSHILPLPNSNNKHRSPVIMTSPPHISNLPNSPFVTNLPHPLSSPVTSNSNNNVNNNHQMFPLNRPTYPGPYRSMEYIHPIVSPTASTSSSSSSTPSSIPHRGFSHANFEMNPSIAHSYHNVENNYQHQRVYTNSINQNYNNNNNNNNFEWNQQPPPPPQGQYYYRAKKMVNEGPSHLYGLPNPHNNNQNNNLNNQLSNNNFHNNRKPILKRTATLPKDKQFALGNRRDNHFKSLEETRKKKANGIKNEPQYSRFNINSVTPFNTAIENWSPEEVKNKRRLLYFDWSLQDNDTFQIFFKPISQKDYVPDSPVVSCIYWDYKDEYYITSVDVIFLLERFCGSYHGFDIREKNRIRRNLQTLESLTIGKTNQTSVSQYDPNNKLINPSGRHFIKHTLDPVQVNKIFDLIMKYESPRPRRIEKDLKIYKWSLLEEALLRVLTKYCYDRNVLFQ